MSILRQFRRKNVHTESELIAAIDIGTSKTCCIIAALEAPDQLRVVGVGHQASKGMRSGSVINMQDVELSILNAVHIAEQSARETIKDIVISVTNCQSKSVDVEIPVSGHSVDGADVKRLLTLSRQLEDPAGQDPIHIIPTGYTIDGRSGIRDPRGMYGDILGVHIHTVYTQTSNLRNLSTCISRCHLRVKDAIAAPLASGYATLVEDEMDLGAIVIDLGAGTTTIGVFSEGDIIYTDSLSIGGHHVTSDIARVLSTPLSQAERLKTLYGSALPSTADEREVVKVPQIGESLEMASTQVAKADLVRIIRPRIEETFELINSRLKANGIGRNLGTRIVLTGGGSQLQGIQEVAAAVMDKQVRIGRPLHGPSYHETLAGPSFSTVCGLLQVAQTGHSEASLHQQPLRESRIGFGRLGSWLKDNI